MTYEQAKARQTELFKATAAAGAVLSAYPKGPMGLTPDHIKQTDQWRKQKAAFDAAFTASRSFNAWLAKTYAKEYRAERKARIEAMTR